MAAEVELSSRIRADDLVESEIERESLDRLREIVGRPDGAMERHGARCFLIVERLAALRGVAIDRELMLVASLVHDIGLYEEASDGGVYVAEGREWAAELIGRRADWDPARIELCGKAIERHHELRSQWAAGPEVELLRRADLLEVSGGLISFGAGRAWIRRLFAAVPRDGIYEEIFRLVLKAARERPATIPRAFVRGRG